MLMTLGLSHAAATCKAVQPSWSQMFTWPDHRRSRFSALLSPVLTASVTTSASLHSSTVPAWDLRYSATPRWLLVIASVGGKEDEVAAELLQFYGLFQRLRSPCNPRPHCACQIYLKISSHVSSLEWLSSYLWAVLYALEFCHYPNIILSKTRASYQVYEAFQNLPRSGVKPFLSLAFTSIPGWSSRNFTTSRCPSAALTCLQQTDRPTNDWTHKLYQTFCLSSLRSSINTQTCGGGGVWLAPNPYFMWLNAI